MTDLDGLFRMQRDMLALGNRQLSAMSSGIGAGRDMLSAQKALTDMAEANLAVWRGWMALWGVRV